MQFKLFIISLLLFSHACLAKTATPLGCLIEPDRIAEVGSQVIGVAESVLVERGDVVKKGQILATLRSEVERASVGVARTRSQLDAEVRSAEANLHLARITEKRGETLVQKNFLSQQALDKSRAETRVAEQRLEQAREQLRISSGELAVANAQLGLRAIRSPIDGIIADRFIWPGERVEEKSLFRVVKTNPLRVELVLPVETFGTIKKASIIKVTPELPNMSPIDAQVTLVDKVIDGASNTFRVRAEIPNPDLAIPSGLRCAATLPNDSEKIAVKYDYDSQVEKLKISSSMQKETSKSNLISYHPAQANSVGNTPLILEKNLSVNSKKTQKIVDRPAKTGTYY